MMQKKIEFSPPDITQEEIDAVVDVLKGGWITTGNKTKQFEKEIAQYCEADRAVCLNSATACMEMVLRLFEIGPGDEVITSVYTYSASAAVVDHVGAKIVFVDTIPGTCQIDPELIEAAITERTKVIIPVDIAGVMSDYKRIMEITKRKADMFRPNSPMQAALGRIMVLADAAHSFGSSRDGILSGGYADFSCFSFHAIKNLTTAEGGAIVWKSMQGMDDDEIYRQLMLLSLHGQSKDALAKMNTPGAWEYDILMPAYKCNMTDIMGALGRAQLKRFPGMMERRKEITMLYDRLLEGAPVWTLKHSGADYQSNMHLYMVRVNGADEAQRNEIIKYMAERDVASNVHFKPLPLMTAYKNLGFHMEGFPNAYEQYHNEVSLPLHTLLSDEDVEHIVNVFLEAVEYVSGGGGGRDAGIVE